MFHNKQIEKLSELIQKEKGITLNCELTGISFSFNKITELNPNVINIDDFIKEHYINLINY